MSVLSSKAVGKGRSPALWRKASMARGPDRGRAREGASRAKGRTVGFDCPVKDFCLYPKKNKKLWDGFRYDLKSILRGSRFSEGNELDATTGRYRHTVGRPLIHRPFMVL